MEDESRKEFKKLSGERSRLIWEIAKTGDLSTLSPEDKKLAEIMLEHEEYHNQFEMADVLSDTNMMRIKKSTLFFTLPCTA